LHESNVRKVNEILSQNFWKLEKWYRYFLKTQSHNNLMEKEYINKTTKYRWRCKDDCERGNFMGSGLDDYPRVEN
jgi:tRNA U38,U39,U40 pseudouridine synthase TruA